MKKIKLNVFLVAFLVCLSKFLILGSTNREIFCFGIVGLVYLVDYYLHLRREVINENLFRTQVNQDIGLMKEDISRLKAVTSGHNLLKR